MFVSGPITWRESSDVYTLDGMTPRRKYSFWIDEAQADGLKAVKERDGVLESEQIRRAINDWLQKKGVLKAERKRASTRTRP
jgi:hypothetical protein